MNFHHWPQSLQHCRAWTVLLHLKADPSALSAKVRNTASKLISTISTYFLSHHTRCCLGSSDPTFWRTDCKAFWSHTPFNNSNDPISKILKSISTTGVCRSKHLPTKLPVGEAALNGWLMLLRRSISGARLWWSSFGIMLLVTRCCQCQRVESRRSCSSLGRAGRRFGLRARSISVNSWYPRAREVSLASVDDLG